MREGEGGRVDINGRERGRERSERKNMRGREREREGVYTISGLSAYNDKNNNNMYSTVHSSHSVCLHLIL